MYNQIDRKVLKYSFYLQDNLFSQAELTGSLIPKKAIIDLSINYALDLPSFNDVYRCKVSYGDDLSVELTGEDDFVLPEKGDIK